MSIILFAIIVIILIALVIWAISYIPLPDPTILRILQVLVILAGVYVIGQRAGVWWALDLPLFGSLAGAQRGFRVARCPTAKFKRGAVRPLQGLYSSPPQSAAQASALRAKVRENLCPSTASFQVE